MRGVETLVYSNHSRDAAASTCLTIMFPIDCLWHILVPLFNSSANAAIVSVQALPVVCHYNAGTNVGRGSLETIGNRVFDIMPLTWDE